MTEKGVGRSRLSMVLGAVCVLLAAAAGVVAFMLNDNINQFNSYVSLHSYTDQQYGNMNASLYLTRSQLDEVTSIVDFQNSRAVYDVDQEIELPGNFSTDPEIGEYSLDGYPAFGKYAGVAYVQVSSTRNDTYVNVTYANSKIFVPEFRYTTETDVGTSGTVAFPIVPADFINIRIGFREPNATAYANVTITYRY